MNQEATDIKAAVAAQLANYSPTEADRPPEESPYQMLTLQQMRERPEYTEKPKVLVDGILHQGTQLMTAAASKMRKTWMAMQLGFSIASGTEFLGRATSQGDVLMVDYELMAPFLLDRFDVLERELGVTVGNRLQVMSLEKVRWNPDELLDVLRGHQFAFISLDPLYKLLGARSENDGAEVSDFLAEIDTIIHGTGATVGITHHHRKGKLSDVSPIDRGSGSGRLARDPDTIINITGVDDEDLGVNHAQLDITVRNFAPVDPQIIRYEYPRWRTTDMDPRSVAEYTKVDIIKLAAMLPEDGATLAQWRDILEGRGRMKWSAAIRDTIRNEVRKGRYVRNEEGMYYPTKEVLT